ncbi:hypothetical protein [Microbulbifer sp. JTAC008]|uniref:hypothetical protein n=1 Tax=unclassified Microbulbifer TaxID=2619833 RepID=UPI002B2C2970|nr:hypothetical protein QT397_10725 [Microbulbifer sp. MKSA007]
MRVIITLFICLLPMFTQAGVQSESDNKLYIKMIESAWGKNGIVIKFDREITYDGTNPGCEWGWSVFVSKDNNAMMDHILSIALAAQMAQKPVKVYVEDTCSTSRAELISLQIWNEE